MPDPLLFFAILPPPPIAQVIDQVRQAHGIDRRYPPDRLHITLRLLGLRREIGETAIEAARDAAAEVRAAPFHVVFDRIDSRILQATETIAGLLTFRAALDAALARPHVPSPPKPPVLPAHHFVQPPTASAGRSMTSC